jgi:hypothetical protein
VPLEKVGFPINCAAVQLEVVALTVQVKEALPLAPVESVAVTVTEDEPEAVGVPEIRPVDELIDKPAGSPLAEYVNVWPEVESLAETCRLAAVPTVAVCVPGFVTVTVLPVEDPLTFQLKAALAASPVVSVAVTTDVYEPAVVGVPEIRPVEELIDTPAGSPFAL